MNSMELEKYFGKKTTTTSDCCKCSSVLLKKYMITNGLSWCIYNICKQIHPEIALTLIFPFLQWNCEKYQSFYRNNFTYE